MLVRHYKREGVFTNLVREKEPSAESLLAICGDCVDSHCREEELLGDGLRLHAASPLSYKRITYRFQ
jgi:hypothetical protein